MDRALHLLLTDSAIVDSNMLFTLQLELQCMGVYGLRDAADKRLTRASFKRTPAFARDRFLALLEAAVSSGRHQS